MDIDVFFEELEALLKKIGLETSTLPGEEPQLGHTLRTMMPVTEAGDKVLLEVLAAQYDEGALLLSIYSTMIAEIGPGYETLKDILVDWNLSCPLGAFGIYRANRQFYHKYNYLIPTNGDAKEMALEVFYVIHLVSGVIGQYFPEAVRLSGHM